MGLTKPKSCQLWWIQPREHRGPSLTSPRAVAAPQFSQGWPWCRADVQLAMEGATPPGPIPIPCQLCSPLGAAFWGW